jgi:hypothetical protein
MELQVSGLGWELLCDDDTIVLRRKADVPNEVHNIPTIEERVTVPGIGALLKFIDTVLFQGTWVKKEHVARRDSLTSIDGILYDLLLAMENRAFLGCLVIQGTLGIIPETDLTWEGADASLVEAGYGPCKRLVREVVLSKNPALVDALRAALKMSLSGVQSGRGTEARQI